jgi:hypothetical protein
MTPEPFPWFVLALVALAATGVAGISAARVFRYHLQDAALEQQLRARHDALMPEVTEPTPES